MKDDLERIFYMGLGAMSLTTEKAKKLKEELFEKGEEAYKTGKNLNEELKHNFSEKVKNEISDRISKDTVARAINKMSDKDREELLKMLKEKKETK